MDRSGHQHVPDASRPPPRLAERFHLGVHLTITVDIAATAIADLACSQHATRVATASDRVSISLARGDERLNRDFVLRGAWRRPTDRLDASLPAFVRRALRHRVDGRQRHVPGAAAGRLFVLDRSGFMQGPKMASAARACSLLLGTLGPADRFALLAFNERAQWLTGDSESLVPADLQASRAANTCFARCRRTVARSSIPLCRPRSAASVVTRTRRDVCPSGPDHRRRGGR